MKIKTSQEDFLGFWYAVDEDTYDGAEDGNNTMGWGDTEEEAKLDLIDKLQNITKQALLNIEAEIQKHESRIAELEKQIEDKKNE